MLGVVVSDTDRCRLAGMQLRICVRWLRISVITHIRKHQTSICIVCINARLQRLFLRRLHF